MKILRKVHEFIRQNEKNVKSPQKHDVNLQKNSTLYFQIGLIVCLLATYGVLEMRFSQDVIEFTEGSGPFPDDEIPFDAPTFVIEIPEQQEAKIVEVKVQPIIDEIEVTKNPILDSPDLVTPESNPNIVETDPTPFEVEKVPEDLDVIFMAVEEKPVFPGCENESSEAAKMKCFEQKMAKFIDRKFNNEIASQYGLKGLQKIHVTFKIDKNGDIVDIKANAPHPALEKEALKVIGKLPKMTPGKQREQPVSVLYYQPILFQVN